MSSGYKLTYHKDAVKFITKQEKQIQERIAHGLKGLLVIPPAGDIKPMKGYVGLLALHGRVRELNNQHQEAAAGMILSPLSRQCVKSALQFGLTSVK